MLDAMSKAQPIVEKQAPFLAGQPAIDFLNTEWPNDSGGEDFFNTDDDVLLWLRQAGIAPEGVTVVRPSGSLLRAARALRSPACGGHRSYSLWRVSNDRL